MKKRWHRKKLNNREIVTLTVILVALIITLTLISATWYGAKYNTSKIIDDNTYREYKYHYMLIGQAKDEEFWSDIYEGTKREGEKNDVYVEDLQAHLEQEYSTIDMMTMAIASQVDAIIVEGDNTKELDAMINKASELNIPVITILEDNPQSKRKSFVGINDYQLGEMYGSQILKLAKGQGIKVTVLIEESDNLSIPNLVYSGIKERVLDENIIINPVIVNHKESFHSEEIIRSIILGKEQPDILICLTEVDTICASQAVVDYNVVGSVDIVGYYYSKEILESIKKEIISASIAIKTQEIGEKAIETLYTYRNEKHVTEYVQVEAELITKENLETFEKMRKNNEIEKN